MKGEASLQADLKRLVTQAQEADRVATQPRVKRPLPKAQHGIQGGNESLGIIGANLVEDRLWNSPLYAMACHFSDMLPGQPARGAHRHISGPILFCYQGRGWEVNDGITYEFEEGDLIVVTPYTVHQHFGDPKIGAKLWIPQAGRMLNFLGVFWNEQHKFAQDARFHAGTEPIYNEKHEAVGFRILKGTLGLEQDLEIMLGANPKIEGVFVARRQVRRWEEKVATTYDRYLKLLAEETHKWFTVPHVVRWKDVPWEQTRQGKIKFLLHPDTPCSFPSMYFYVQDLPPGGRSGKHRHFAEEILFIMEGRGYDVHDGVRYDWEKGDLVCIPVLAEHQHFNADPKNPARFASVQHALYAYLGLGGIEQLEDAPAPE